MRKKEKIFIISFISAQLLHAALTDEEIIRIMDEKSVGRYNINPAEHDLPATSSGFIILNYDDELIEGTYRILEDVEQQAHWKQAFRTLRRIATANPKSLDFNRLLKQIQKIENSENISNDEKIDLLTLGYPAVARHRTNPAFEFLKARTEFDFWKDNDINRTVYNSHGAGSEGILKTGQTEAIGAIDEIQTENAYELLQSLANDPRYVEKPHLHLALRSSIEYGWAASEGRLKTIQNEYAKRLELRGDSSTDQITKETGIEILSASASDVVETPTPPKPTTEKPGEATTSESFPKDTEKSSNRWLWLIGLLAIVGGLFALFRRKQ